MPLQSWQQTLINAQVDGAAVGNTVTETSLLPAQAKLTLPANYFQFVGQKLRLRAAGRISNTVTTVTLILKVKFGATAVATSPTWSLVARATTNVTWELDLVLDARAIGATANLMPIGKFVSEAALGSAANVAVGAMWPLSAPAVGSNFDSTVAQVVDLTATWGTAAAGNTLQLHQYALESMN